MLECKNIKKNYGQFSLDISLNLYDREILGIVGPSGSGKSTLLRIISGLESPDSKEAEIILDGKKLNDVNPRDRGIGFVFQRPALFENMNVMENITYSLRCRHIQKKERNLKGKEFLALLNMSGFEKRKVNTLSGGEAQRVSLARTLISNPKVILFDEPLSALDVRLKKDLALEIKKLQEKFLFSAIMVTHDLEEAKNLCTRIIVIKQGKKIWEGKTEEFSDSML